MKHARVWAEIDASAFASNLRAVRRRIADDARLVLVLKADAYGHGARELAPLARRAGVDAFGVATVSEALELRKEGPQDRLIVLGTTFSGELDAALAAELELVVATPAQLLELVTRVGRSARRHAVRVHLHFDTGMHRLGLDPASAEALIRVLREAPRVQVVGLMTHIASTSGALDASAAQQVERFQQVARRFQSARALAPDAWLHVANSAGVLSGLTSLTNAVRVGVAAYGLAPHAKLGEEALRPVLALRARVAQIHRLAAGERVGYDGTWTAERPSWIATIAAGYADGLPFRLSGRGQALVRGRRVPIVGRVSMDYAALDITELGPVPEGSTVTLVGREGDQAIDAWELARVAETSPYEVITAIGRRVPRVVIHDAPLPHAGAELPARLEGHTASDACPEVLG